MLHLYAAPEVFDIDSDFAPAGDCAKRDTLRMRHIEFYCTNSIRYVGKCRLASRPVDKVDRLGGSVQIAGENRPERCA